MNDTPYNQEYKDPFEANGSYEDELSQLSDPYRDADVEKPQYEPVPDGTYQINVEKAELARAKSSGRLMLKWTLRILAPTHRNRMLWKNSVISRASLRWLKQDLYTCGLELEDITKLEASLHRLLDIKLEIKIVSKGENSNIYFNKRIVMSPEEEAQRRGEVPPDARAQF